LIDIVLQFADKSTLLAWGSAMIIKIKK
jgi:hypothetical protein